MKKKLICTLFTCLLSLGFLVACGKETDDGSKQPTTVPSYELGSSSEYVSDGQKCISYRVAISADSSDDELTAAFYDICESDNYYLHTVFFYSSLDLADGGNAYDIAMLEETEENSEPQITR